MNHPLKSLAISAAALAVVFLTAGGQKTASGLTPKEALGKQLFFDPQLSDPPGQSCAVCHDPRTGWTGDPENSVGIYEGARKGRFGNRRPPSSAYAGAAPVLSQDKDGVFTGGMFWDGRATGRAWKDPLAEQAGGPFLNPLEQNLADRKAVIAKVRASSYAADFARVWNVRPEDWDKDTDRLYESVCRSIAAFERSAEVNPYDSKFDAFWRAARAKNLDPAKITMENAWKFRDLGLDVSELHGLLVFVGDGKCAECHTMNPGPNGEPPVFTDFTYDNLGIPRNPDNPFYRMGREFNPHGAAWIDEGLGGFFREDKAFASEVASNLGKHKVPTLRNVDLRPTPGFVKTYGHNGFFKSLPEIIHFYNVRDLGGFPPPEVAANVNKDEMGNLGLSAEEEESLLRFLKTLSDGFGRTGK